MIKRDNIIPNVAIYGGTDKPFIPLPKCSVLILNLVSFLYGLNLKLNP